VEDPRERDDGERVFLNPIWTMQFFLKVFLLSLGALLSVLA
jgi:hypothetical protein